MKTLKIILTLCIVTLLLGCAVSTTRTSSYNFTPTPLNVEIILYDSINAISLNSQKIGNIDISNNWGFPDWGWYEVLEKAKNACRKMGGNAIQLIETGVYNQLLYAYAWKIPEKEYFEMKQSEKTRYTEAIIKEKWENKGIDEIEGIYEQFGDGQSAKYTFAIIKKNILNKVEYNVIYLSGEPTQFRSIWSEGDLKAKFINAYRINDIEWYMPDKSKKTNVRISFDEKFMKTYINGVEDIYLKVYPTTERTAITGSGASSSEWKGNGSGFFIDCRGYIATNYHVVKDATQIEVNFIRDGQQQVFNAEVTQSDRQNDLAILKIINNSFKPFTNIPYNFQTIISDVGTNIFALGYPMADVMGSEIKFTDGKISSRTGIQGDVRIYQISVPIQAGNSGGALFDYNGNLIGITSAGLNREYFNSENVNYAIKSLYLKSLIDVLPVAIQLPNDKTIANKTLTEKIKILSDYVVLVKVK